MDGSVVTKTLLYGLYFFAQLCHITKEVFLIFIDKEIVFTLIGSVNRWHIIHSFTPFKGYI
jgi:hypothetical protein